MKSRNLILKTLSIVHITLFIMSCSNYKTKNVIDSFVLVVPNNFYGDIIIFFEQDYDKGNAEHRNYKDYFYVKDNGIFFTKKKLGKGNFKFYDTDGNVVEYVSTMQIGNADPNSFQVIGGAYRGIMIEEYSSDKFCNFVIFKAGYAKNICDNWFVSDSAVKVIYEYHK